MGFLTRRMKRHRIAHRAKRHNAAGNPIVIALRLVAFLAFYVVLSSFLVPRSSGWRYNLRHAIEKQLGWKHHSPKQTPQPNPMLFGEHSDGGHQKHQIPCGLIVIEDDRASTVETTSEDEEDVLPLKTFAVVPAESSTSHAAAVSTLHARALEKYPDLKRYVVKSEEELVKGVTRIIPGGTFRLRMGGEESTIEESPPLWIIEDEPGRSESDSDTPDLVLGTAFWKDHKAEFGSDEVYLFPSSETNSGEQSASRVMVPYLRMRSRPSFGTDDL